MKFFALIPLLLLPVACGGGDTKKVDTNKETKTEVVENERKAGPLEGEHMVECGCTIEGIKKCGNYVHVDGHAFEIQGDLGLGKMEWCGSGQHAATVKGALVGDKFQAESLVVKP